MWKMALKTPAASRRKLPLSEEEVGTNFSACEEKQEFLLGDVAAALWACAFLLLLTTSTCVWSRRRRRNQKQGVGDIHFDLTSSLDVTRVQNL
jgi:hypothetical protein